MSWYEELDRWTADYLPDMIYEHDAALAKYTSFRIGGAAHGVPQGRQPDGAAH